jgi:septum formation protein
MSASAPTNIVLASTSAIRQAVLRGAGLEFEAVSPGVDEETIKASLMAEGVSPRDIADALAEAKAVKVSRRRPGLVIGADQTLDLDGRLFDKAATVDEARERLREMRGNTHKLHCGMVVARDGTPIWREVVTATLRMRAFSDDYLEGYLQRNAPGILSSVGCYQLEGEGVQLFDRIEGDYFAILGLSLIPLLDLLRRHGAVPL